MMPKEMESRGTAKGTPAKTESVNKRKANRQEVDSFAERTPVAMLMSRDVVTVKPDMPIDQLTQLFLDRGISGAPVIDETGNPIGIISKTDLVRATYEAGGTSTVVSGGSNSTLEDRSTLEPGFSRRSDQRYRGRGDDSGDVQSFDVNRGRSGRRPYGVREHSSCASRR